MYADYKLATHSRVSVIGPDSPKSIKNQKVSYNVKGWKAIAHNK